MLDVAVSLVEELAKLHAAYWGADLPWLGTHTLSPGDGPEQEERMAGGAAIVQSAIDQFADELPPEFRQLGELYVDRYRDIGALWNEGERTLVHGDDHIGNLFVDGRPDRVLRLGGRQPVRRDARRRLLPVQLAAHGGPPGRGGAR